MCNILAKLKAMCMVKLNTPLSGPKALWQTYIIKAALKAAFVHDINETTFVHILVYVYVNVYQFKVY